MARFLAAALFLILSARAYGQYPARPPQVDPLKRIEISLDGHFGRPGIDHTSTTEYLGFGLGASFTLTKLRFWMFDLDARGFYSSPVREEDRYENQYRGKLYDLSIGAPIKIGKVAFFTLRPGICFQIFSHAEYDLKGMPQTFRRFQWERSLGIGLTLDVGIQVYIDPRISFTASFCNEVYILRPHHGQYFYFAPMYTRQTNESAWTSVFLFFGMNIRFR
ncbi:MAG: hypothetical protein ACYTFG_08530 [Planctomycetota bacterium]|jgi:hypothetical protein